MANYVVRFARTAVISALFVVAAILGTASGLLFAYTGDLPQISALDNYNPSTITRVLASDGSSIGEFAVQRRVVVGYDDISPYFHKAIIASEDAGFNSHVGVSISAIILRAGRDALDYAASKVTKRNSRPAGASTLTMQLARTLFAERVGFELGDTSLDRKIKETIVAIQIEKRYTKHEILTLYANQMLFGHGTYGVESAARLYFAKSAKDLNLDEAALLAGIVQSPARQSPFVNMEAAKRRRAYVVRRMAEEGYITATEAAAVNERPIITRGQPQPEKSTAPFFLEEIRKHLERQYGAKALYESGLSVTTTLDAKLQAIANVALQDGLRAIDKRRGFRKPRRNLVEEKKIIDSFKDERWTRPIAAGDVVPAVVASIAKPAPGAKGAAAGPVAKLNIGPYHADLSRDGLAAWNDRTRRSAISDLVKTGDVIEVRVDRIDDATHAAVVSLEQTPLVEGALVAIENRTGQIKAMIGGWDFARSKFNRAVQAYRQIGSTFKPIVYTTAIDRGYTPVSIIVDEPVTYQPGPNQPPYEPQNYDKKFEGPITLRRALEDSRNIPAIKMMDMLGPPNVLGYAKRFGFEENFPPVLAIALGAGDATLLEVTSAYTVFPNGGVRMKPFDVVKVTDREGNLLEENRAQPTDVIRADTAYVMTSLLEGVIQRGTAEAAKDIAWPLAGKTGTVDDNTDAWFIGFDPDMTVGVWVGLDEKKPIGFNETGAIAALPIWMSFMKAYIAGRPDHDEPPSFRAPGNIVTLAVDKGTGAIVEQGAANAIEETFIAGTQPGGLSHSP